MQVSVPENSGTQELIFKYVDGQPLYLTFLPPVKQVRKKAPVFVVVSGGGWQVQSREAILNMFSSSVAQLREAGVCVVSMDYRVTGTFPGADVAQAVGDALDAISYLHRYADLLSIDMDSVILTGHSAGGHIVQLMACTPREMFPTEYPDPGICFAGCIPFSAPCFLYPSESCPEPLRMNYDYIFPGAVYDDRMAHLWSPYEYITKQCPPTLFIHGGADDLVPVANTLLSYEKGIELGADFSLIYVVNGGHCLEPMQAGVEAIPSYEEVQNRIAAWVLDRFKL